MNLSSPVCSITNSKNMRTQFPKCCSFILFHHVSVIQMRQSLKWINCYQDIASVCLKRESKSNIIMGIFPFLPIFVTCFSLRTVLKWGERVIWLTQISLSSYLAARFCRTPGSCRYESFVMSSTPPGGASVSFGKTFDMFETICRIQSSDQNHEVVSSCTRILRVKQHAVASVSFSFR